MKLTKKIKNWFSTEKKCDICGKVISAKKNPESIKVSLGYSKDVLMSFTNEEIYFSIEPEFYLCGKHRKLLEEFIVSLKVDEIERKTGKKIDKPINITVEYETHAYLENGKEVDLNQTNYDQWAVKKESKENLGDEGKIKKEDIDNWELTDLHNIGYPYKEKPGKYIFFD